MTNNIAYAEIASDTLNYIKRALTNENGGFYSAEDADSEGIEGLFYIWSPDEIRQILKVDAEEFSQLYNITEQGNFEGKNIPNLIGKEIPAEKRQWAQKCIEKLFAYRENRVHPFKDDKILVSWNGLAIAAFSYAGKALKNKEYLDIAEKATDFINKNMLDKNGRLLSRFRDNEAKYTAHAEDYSYYIWGLIELHNATLSLASRGQITRA